VTDTATTPAIAVPAAEPFDGTSTSRALLRLAWPVLASQFLRLAYQWVDALWVRGLGVEATAAVTTSMFVLWWVYALNDIFAIGVISYVSQLMGSGERRRAGVAAFHGIRASALLGLLGSVLGLFAAHRLYGWMDPDPRMVEVGGAYLSIVLLGAPLPMIALTCESIMRSAGDTRTPLLLDLGAVALNALLDPLLIYGPGPFPAWGVAGAAWATVIAQGSLVVCYLALAARRHRAFPLARRADGPRIRTLGMARVGIPAAIVGMSFSVVYVVFARVAAQFGTPSMAVVGIVNRVEALQFLSAIAIGGAAAALVGQSLGAGRPDRAVEVIRTGLKWELWIAGTLSVVMAAAPAAFIGLFSHDPEVLRLGTTYLRITTLCFIVNGLEIVTVEAIMGSGHTRATSWIFLIFSLLRIPLAFLVPHWTGLGVIGIAWVITGTCVVRGALILAWAARGTWKSGLARELQAASPVTDPGGAV
jgi:putative MATE family efflux protein